MNQRCRVDRLHSKLEERILWNVFCPWNCNFPQANSTAYYRPRNNRDYSFWCTRTITSDENDFGMGCLAKQSMIMSFPLYKKSALSIIAMKTSTNSTSINRHISIAYNQNFIDICILVSNAFKIIFCMFVVFLDSVQWTRVRRKVAKFKYKILLFRLTW